MDEILVPLAPTAADFRTMFKRAVDALEINYGALARNTLQTVEMMVKLDLDEILVRRETPDDTGLISWAGGNSLVQGARELLVASAKATSKPRRRFANAESTIAEDFLAACRMGQTQVGSYVVTALAPTHGSFAASRNNKKTPVFRGRDITQTLVNALGASSEAIVEAHSGAGPENFEAYVPNGVSLELLRGLRHVVSDEVESSVTVEVHSDESLFEEHRPATQEFVFTPEDAFTLARAEKYFEQAPAPQVREVSGEVVLLKNSALGGEHQIKVRGKLDGVSRTVTVTLSPEQYESALQAHRDQVRLTVRGEMEKKSRRLIIHESNLVRVESDQILAPRSDEPEFDFSDLLDE
ncbi:hypothetical protein FEF27_12850 [Nesterenkonia sphaerica]|uniref:Uncharacterized protein n=1 Tax=Nesterenkonia sphaerica TaxID=1804988 RepID=A0A5R8ZYR4_9MICC|nr:hypothetical protein FEF27_12850 [Nesterenkonia sphaerica]